jgi:hypothetical protein
VAHLVVMLSKHLGIPLRYRLVLKGSCSSVCDDIQSYSQFPLFSKSVENRRFECACILLNKNRTSSCC